MMRAERVIVRGSNRTHNYPIKHWHYNSAERALICEELELPVCEKVDPTDCGLKDAEEKQRAPDPHPLATKVRHVIDKFSEDTEIENLVRNFNGVLSTAQQTAALIRMVCQHDVREFKLRRRIEALEAIVQRGDRFHEYVEKKLHEAERRHKEHQDNVYTRMSELTQRAEAFQCELNALNDFAVRIVREMPKQRKTRKKKK